MSVNLKATSKLPTRFGEFDIYIFVDKLEREHIVLTKGSPTNDCLVRIHSECATGDIMGSLRCDCRDQLEKSLQAIDAAGIGLLIYVRGHEGRGIGLVSKIKAYALQDEGMDTVDANLQLGYAADQRDYAPAVSILKYFDLTRVKLLTNNRAKIDVLEKGGIAVEHVSLWTSVNPHSQKYIATKRTRMGHIS